MTDAKRQFVGGGGTKRPWRWKGSGAVDVGDEYFFAAAICRGWQHEETATMERERCRQSRRQLFFTSWRFVGVGGVKRPWQWKGSGAVDVDDEYFFRSGNSSRVAAQRDRGNGKGAVPTESAASVFYLTAIRWSWRRKATVAMEMEQRRWHG